MVSGSQPGSSPSAASLDETLSSRGRPGQAFARGSFERGDLVGRYVILEDIGRGAMGLVVAAYDPELDRKVAVKLLRVAPGASEPASVARGRLIREAQAMAKLAHPNVITVHDVGAVGDDVFIAMEFIDGGSLRDWLAREPRAWPTIVATFVQAGEGLAAAHAQGIVHRDFKPDNVLIRSDGRVSVADFGLARRDPAGGASGGATGGSGGDELQSSTDGLEPMTSTLRESSVDALGNLTMTGATLGTPAYMAPEQHLRTRIDHRCDQFGFCVALWEALVGSRPFAGATLGAIALNVTAGKNHEFPRDSPVPPRVRAALVRGLQNNPEARFPSMKALLDELRRALRAERIRSSRRPWARVWIAGLGLAAVVAGALVVDALSNQSQPAPRLCVGASERMVGVWDAAAKAEARAAFERSKRPFASRSFARAAATLDDLSEQWVASHTAACVATRVYGEQSEDLLDRRMSCLAQRRGEIAAVSAALRVGETETIEGVDQLLATIEPIASCDELERLRAEFTPPSADQRAAVDGLRERLAQLEVARRTAEHTKVSSKAAALLAEAEALGYAPVIAEALNFQASLLETVEGPNRALPIARKAMAIAATAGHRRALVEAMALLGWIEGVGRGDFDLGLWLLDQAEAEAHALGDPVRLSLKIKSNRGAVHYSAADYDAALREFEVALNFARAELGEDHVRVADLRFNLAAVADALGRFEQAEHGFRLAIERYTELMGAEHPEVAQCHSNLASTLKSRGKLDEAEDHAKQAIQLWQADGGHSYLPSAYSILGEIRLRRDDPAGALPWFEQAYAMKSKTFGEDSPSTRVTLAGLAKVEHLLDRKAEARAHYERGIELGSVSDPSHPTTLELRIGLADLETAEHDFAAAQAQILEVEAQATEARGETDLYVAVAQLSRALLEHERGREREARAALTRAEVLLEDASDLAVVAQAKALRQQLGEQLGNDSTSD